MADESARAAQVSRPTARALAARAVPVLVLAVVAAALYGGGASGALTLANLQAHEEALRAFVAHQPLLFLAGFVTLYAVATASFVPMGMILMLTGGFLLGPWIGAAAAVLGTAGGAAIGYLAARVTAGELLASRMGDGKLGKLIAGFGDNAFAYMLTLRLIPLSPFGLVNVAAGAAHAPFRAYLAATVVGSIPICLIYANLGAGLGEAFQSGRQPDLSVMTDPQVAVPLACLALISLASVFIGRRRQRTGVTPPRSH
jgi:uncharacterized membrane protein YdjX (TVP38/TMEM64 family)